MRRTLAAIAGSLILASSAAAQSAPAKLSATTTASADIKPGVYDLSITMGGGTIDGKLTLTQQGHSLTAKMFVADHDTPMIRIVSKGPRLTIEGGGGGMNVSYDLQFKGDALAGTLNFNGDAGTVSGKRRPAGG